MSEQYVYTHVPRATRVRNTVVAFACTVIASGAIGIGVYESDAAAWAWPCLTLFAFLGLYGTYRCWTTTQVLQRPGEARAIGADSARQSAAKAHSFEDWQTELWKTWIWGKWYVRYALSVCVVIATFALLSFLMRDHQNPPLLFWVLGAAGVISASVLAYEAVVFGIVIGIVWWGISSLAALPPTRIAHLALGLIFFLIIFVGFSLHQVEKSLEKIRRSHDEIRLQQDEMRRSIAYLQMKPKDSTAYTYDE